MSPGGASYRAERDAVLHAAEVRGFITHRQLAEVLPDADPDMIEDLLTVLQERGITLVDEDEPEEG